MSCTIPREALESFARVILPDIYKFYESEENLRAYEGMAENRRRSETPKRN